MQTVSKIGRVKDNAQTSSASLTKSQPDSRFNLSLNDSLGYERTFIRPNVRFSECSTKSRSYARKFIRPNAKNKLFVKISCLRKAQICSDNFLIKSLARSWLAGHVTCMHFPQTVKARIREQPIRRDGKKFVRANAKNSCTTPIFEKSDQM